MEKNKTSNNVCLRVAATSGSYAQWEKSGIFYNGKFRRKESL